MILDPDETHRFIHVREELRTFPEMPEWICRARRTCVYVTASKPGERGMPQSVHAIVGFVEHSQWAGDDKLEASVSWVPNRPFRELLDQGLYALHVEIGRGGYIVEMRPDTFDYEFVHAEGCALHRDHKGDCRLADGTWSRAGEWRPSVQRATVPGMAEQVHGED